MEDSFEIVEPEPVILHTPTLWLIGQAFELLNAASEAAAVACAHVVQLLKCRDDALDTLTKVLRSSPAEDIGLRWNALYLVGEIGDRSAADLLYRVAVEDIPKSCEDVKACESPRDGADDGGRGAAARRRARPGGRRDHAGGRCRPTHPACPH